MLVYRLRFLLGLILLLCTFIPAAAQSDISVILSQPQTDDFPTIRAYLEAFDANGDFIHGLHPGDVSIIEDNVLINAETLDKEEVGTQFLVALNQGPSFAIRDSNGITRFDTLQIALSKWAENHSSSKDDLNFLSNGGVETLHLETGRAWLQDFQAFEADFRAAIPSLDVLVRAVEVATEPQDQPGKGRSILLITPPPELPSAGTLQTIFSLAQNEHIRINVWMVSSTDYFTSRGATQLADLAAQTGGKFFAFSGTEPVPEVDSYLEPLRSIYELSYESAIKDNESHQVFAQIDINGAQIESNVQSYDLQILPPNPIFISPPLEIVRENDASLSDTLSELDKFKPKKQHVEILVEFPDGYPRPLNRTTLYVDGIVSDERIKPPFDSFTWDLTPYENSEDYILTVEVEDSLGLKSTSIAQKIRITVKRSPQQVFSTLINNAPIISGAAAAFAGGFLLLVLIVKGHIRPRPFGRRRKKRRKTKMQPSSTAALARETPGRETKTQSRFTKFINKFSRTMRHQQPGQISQAKNVVAYLEYIGKNKLDNEHEPIPVKIGVTTFGRDHTKVTTTLDDNAVSNLHARLVVNTEGICQLFDEGSIAGTWINYRLVPTDGEPVHHGDIIHIGRTGLQYKIKNKDMIPKPVVLPLESDS